MENHGHGHLNRISSIVLSVPVLGRQQLERLESCLETIHWENRIPGEERGEVEILRSKGLFVVEEGLYVLQGVRDIFELKRIEGKEVVKEGKLVLIGRGLRDAQMWKDGILNVLG